jgi:hypothetical protein
MDYADFAHFAALDIRAGTVTRAEPFPEAPTSANARAPRRLPNITPPKASSGSG